MDSLELKIAVVYLARLHDRGVSSARAFFDSYSRFAAGTSHSLVVAAKGWERAQQIADLEVIAADWRYNLILLPDDGFDLGAYFRVAASLTDEYLCFLNTHSVVLAPNWLYCLARNVDFKSVGAVAATGSWESHLAPPELLLQRLGTLKLLKRRLAILRNKRVFPGFPNPHLRTNAFIVRRETFNAFARDTVVPRTKRDAYATESGLRGFSQFLRNNKLETIVSGADGLPYRENEWPESGTYRSKNQFNLLIADNQTRQFAEADTVTRKCLQRAAWGRDIDSPP